MPLIRSRVLALTAAAVLAWAGAAGAQAPVEITKTDITKQKTINAAQIAVLGVRLGDARDQTLKMLQSLKEIKVQEDAATNRLLVISPAASNVVVMGVKAVENLVTTINIVGGFGDWLQGDTRLLFRGFEDDSLRYKLLGREDQRQVLRGGTKESPTENVTYAYFKEGILLSLSLKRMDDAKKIEAVREMVFLFPPRAR
jgi:hypothetical protein